MKKVIDEMLTSETFRNGRDEVRKEAWFFPGHAAEKTVDALVSLAAKEDEA